MNFDLKRTTLTAYPLDGWWSRAGGLIDQALSQGLATENTQMNGSGWVQSRSAEHSDLVDELMEGFVPIPRRRVALISGGATGSGKSHVIYQRMWNRQYAIVDPDAIKSEMIKRDMLPEIEQLTPLESAVLGHVESTQIAKQLFKRLVKDKCNVLWDFTMSNPESVSNRVKALNSAGYSSHSFFVNCSEAVAKRRVIARHRRGVEKFFLGQSLGGRYVPFDRINFDAPAKVFEMTKSMFCSFEVVENGEYE